MAAQASAAASRVQRCSAVEHQPTAFTLHCRLLTARAHAVTATEAKRKCTLATG